MNEDKTSDETIAKFHSESRKDDPILSQTIAPASQDAVHQPDHDKKILYTVRYGDTMWDISENYLSKPFRYLELAQSSDINDPNLIHPGEQIKIYPAGSK